MLQFVLLRPQIMLDAILTSQLHFPSVVQRIWLHFPRRRRYIVSLYYPQLGDKSAGVSSELRFQSLSLQSPSITLTGVNPLSASSGRKDPLPIPSSTVSSTSRQTALSYLGSHWFPVARIVCNVSAHLPLISSPFRVLFQVSVSWP